MSSKWISLVTPPGKPEVKARMEELPDGPYFLIPQHQEEKFMRNFLSWPNLDPKKEFVMHLGYATCAIDMYTGLPEKVAYHYCTSN